MSFAPETADWLVIVVGVMLLGCFFALRLMRRSDYETQRFRRELPRQQSTGRLDKMPEDDDEEEQKGQPVEPILNRARLQILLAAIGIAMLTFIAFMNMGENPAGIPLPGSWFD